MLGDRLTDVGHPGLEDVAEGRAIEPLAEPETPDGEGGAPAMAESGAGDDPVISRSLAGGLDAEDLGLDPLALEAVEEGADRPALVVDAEPAGDQQDRAAGFGHR